MPKTVKKTKETTHQECNLDHVNSLFFIVNDSNNIAYINPAVETVLNISKSQLVDKSMMCVFEQAGKLKKLIDKCQQDKQHIYIDNIAIFSLHKRIIVKAHLFINADDTTTGNVASNVYIECQEINVKTLSFQDDNLDKMALVKSIAHEVKNPLGGIRGAAQLLQNQIENRSQSQFLHIIIKEADRLNEWLDRLSSHAVDSLKIPLNIHKVLEHTYALIDAELREDESRAIILKRDYDPSLPDIIGNQSNLIQVFLNLARNAMQSLISYDDQDDMLASKNQMVDQHYYQKKISFKTRLVYDVIIGDKYHKRALKVEIIDNGPGIDDAHLASIFAPLVSYKDGGSGLGLSIAKDIIHDHQGDIIVNSIPFRGTSFSVILPIEKQTKKKNTIKQRPAQ